MGFRLGIVGLCTSHPLKWVPIIRQMTAERLVDVEICAAWDSGEVRPAGFVAEFCQQFDVPRAVQNLEDMVDQVDGVIVHTANWDHHLRQAKPFIEADKSVLIDKPIVGSVGDAQQLLDWARAGKRITGGSSLRFAYETNEYLSTPAAERGELHTACAGCGTDDFGYGIHAYSLLAGLMGPGIHAVQHLGKNKQELIKLTWRDGKVGLLAVGGAEKLPFHLTAVATKNVTQIMVDPSRIYRALLEACLGYLTGRCESPPLPIDVLLEPELAAIAANKSRQSGGAEVTLADLHPNDPSYDGTRYAAEYRLARTAK